MFKYIAIDIETTGLDPEKHQILEFAAILDDLSNPQPIEKLPVFARKICHTDYVINYYCLKMHEALLKEIRELSNKIGGDVIHIDHLAHEFGRWLGENKIVCKYNVAGANFAGFDGQFLKRVPRFPEWNYRVLEVGSMYLTKNMNALPGLGNCDPTPSEEREHRALPDARAVVRAVRAKLL